MLERGADERKLESLPTSGSSYHIEGSAVIAHVLKLEDLLSSVHEVLQVHKAFYIFPKFPCETCLTLCSCGNGYISVLTCALLYLIIRVCIFFSARLWVSWKDKQGRKLNLKTIYKRFSEFVISRIFKNSCLGTGMWRDKRLN